MKHFGKTLRALSGVAVLCSGAFGLAGCTGTTTVQPASPSAPVGTVVVADYPANYVESVPEFEYYPRTYYRGSYAYLVNGRWYYQSGGRWVVFREEPRELYRYRVYEYDRLEPPRRVRGAEYGFPAPPPKQPEQDGTRMPVPPTERYYE